MASSKNFHPTDRSIEREKEMKTGHTSLYLSNEKFNTIENWFEDAGKYEKQHLNYISIFWEVELLVSKL